MTLIEALQNMDIQLMPGRVYNFEADGCQIELRVRQGAKQPTQPMNLDGDTMFDAWVEFPFRPEKILPCHPAKAPIWPDPLIIEEEDEQQ